MPLLSARSHCPSYPGPAVCLAYLFGAEGLVALSRTSGVPPGLQLPAAWVKTAEAAHEDGGPMADATRCALPA